MHHLSIRQARCARPEDKKLLRCGLVERSSGVRDFLKLRLAQIAGVKQPGALHETVHGPGRGAVEQFGVDGKNKLDAHGRERTMVHRAPIDLRRDSLSFGARELRDEIAPPIVKLRDEERLTWLP